MPSSKYQPLQQILQLSTAVTVERTFAFNKISNKSQKLISLFHPWGFFPMAAVPSQFHHDPFFYYPLFSICAWIWLFIFLVHVPALSLCRTVVLEHAAGIWWMITCHSLFIIIQTINYTSLMLVVPLEIYMLGTDQCENGIPFAKCLSVGTAWWLQSGCFNSCVCLTMSSLTACHRSHCSKALFIVLCRLRLWEDKDVAKAALPEAGGPGRSHSRHSFSTHHLPLFPLVWILVPSPPSFLLQMTALY